jgi:hypothetical protein
VTNGLLSKGEREFLRGERTQIQDPDGYRNNVRHRVRQRIDQIEDDLQLLEDAGHDDIVQEFEQKYGADRLAREIEDIQQQLDELGDEFESMQADE